MVNKIAMASFLIAGIAAIMYLVLDHENYFVAEPKPISITAGPIFPTCKEIEDQNKTTKKLANHIPWTKDYCLKWDNFEGEVEIDKNFTAYTYTHTNRYVKTQVTNTSRPEFEIIDIELVPFFNKTKSWVNKTQWSPNDVVLLRHEQGHFDIAKEHAVETEEFLKENVLNKRFSFHLSSGNLTNDAQIEGEKLVEKFWNMKKPELDYQNRLYDTETNHGKIISKQIEYDLRFDKLRE